MNSIVRNCRVYDHKTKAMVPIDVDIEIDVYALAAALAPKAYRNKSRETRLCNGQIRVTVRSEPPK